MIVVSDTSPLTAPTYMLFREHKRMTILRWLTVALILRVLFSILANYPDYFPPNFESLFLQGRERTFRGAYRAAFYVHIITGPIVLACGLILLSETARRRFAVLHRWLGRIQVSVLLLALLPSGVVMSWRSFGGWPAGLSFSLLSAVTAGCAIAGVVQARRRRFELHRRWMLRTYVLLCSAVALRLISGTAELLDVTNSEWEYVIAAWASWVLPLMGFELYPHSSSQSAPIF